MSKPAQNVSTIEFLKHNLKLNLTLQNFSPVHISLYPDSEQQTTDCLRTGRWDNVDRSQGFCNLCTGNLLGDEFHYLLECTYFTEERKKYLPKFYLRHVNTLKFQKLMSTENLKLLKQLSRFMSI